LPVADERIDAMSDVEQFRWQRDLALIADAAKQAGAVALGFFNQSPEVWWKNEDRSPVSAADFICVGGGQEPVLEHADLDHHEPLAGNAFAVEGTGGRPTHDQWIV